MRMVAEACAFIEAEAAMPSLARLAARAGMSPPSFLRAFTAETGVTPRSFAERVHGMRAAARPAGQGPALRLAWLDSRFGRVLLAATPRGACFLGFGDPEPALVGDLLRRFPGAAPVPDALRHLVRPVAAYLADPSAGLVLPLDLHGTPFQQQVWRALTRIPTGRTQTYSALAATIGRPEATRAVARACATNPVSLAVPCHRMLGADGALTGYRWGLAHKAALLAAERTDKIDARASRFGPGIPDVVSSVSRGSAR